jgi:transposase
MTKAMSLVGLDVHARQTHAAVLVPDTGELCVSKLRMEPAGVVSFLEGLGSGVRAVYEAGPTGFTLARAARDHGIEVRVVAPGSIPKGSGDRVKTDRRDAIRLARLLAAGELSFVFVPSVEDEHFRDLIRAIEDVRGDLMRARHRLGKLLLRRGERYPGPGASWSAKHLGWLGSLHFDDACSQATFVDYLASVELLMGRRTGLISALEAQVPDCSHAPPGASWSAKHLGCRPAPGRTGPACDRDRLACPTAPLHPLAAPALRATQARGCRRDRVRA